MKLTTLKGIFPDPKPVRRKNFIQENVRNLRQIEQYFQATKQVDELQQLRLHKNRRPINKYQNISAKVVTSFCERKKHKNNGIESVSKNNVELISPDNIKNPKETQIKVNISKKDKKHVFTKKIVSSRVNNNNIVGKQKRTNKHNNRQKLQPKILSESNVLCKSNNVANDADTQSIITYKNQGIQTLDTDQIKTIYSKGTIRYPSKKGTKHNGDINQEEKKYSKKQSSSPTERGDMHTTEEKKVDLYNFVSPTPKEEIDFIKLNKEHTSVANKLAIQLNNGILPTNYRKGVVPKYLRDRKEAHEKERKAKALHLDCPEGHVPLPDHERKETLRLFKKNYQDYVNELNMMPIKTDTLRAQKRKVEIEKQLNKLEEGIKIFSRPKVYVKINA